MTSAETAARTWWCFRCRSNFVGSVGFMARHAEQIHDQTVMRNPDGGPLIVPTRPVAETRM